ncbi:MAG: CHASE2 domain-containing protein [Cyanobacteria bacterium P01_F01_bin.150]
MAENRVAVLKLEGDMETHGISVTLEVATEGPMAPIGFPELAKRATLPPNPGLVTSLDQWQQRYKELTQPSRSARAIIPHTAKISGSINPLVDICQDASRKLAEQFQEWLRTESFLDLEGELKQAVDRHDTVRVLVQTFNYELRLLPWCQWSFIKNNCNAEIAMGAIEFKDLPQAKATRTINDKVNILAILGSDRNIDIKADQHILNALPGANVYFLEKPSLKEFHEKLYKQSWDILFFAGHSDTVDGEGIIQLNPSTALTIKQIENAVKKAIANGLQLAIFNSCKGLGLAHALIQLQLPQIIVMREVLPDHVAHRFLRTFLTAFADGLPFYQAEREAREELQGMEEEFPCASWLPLIYQHPAKVPPSWQALKEGTSHDTFRPNKTDRSFLQKRAELKYSSVDGIKRTIAISLLSALTIMGFRWGGFLQGWELQSYDHLMQMRSPEESDSRILLVEVQEQDIQKYKHPIPDSVLFEVIRVLSKDQPYAIGLDVYRDHPIPPDTENLMDEVKGNSKLVTVCSFGNHPDQAVAPPPDSQSVGFIDLENDSTDYYVRRALLSRYPMDLSICATPYSFGLQLLFEYLDNSKTQINITETSERDWQFGDKVFKRLSAHSGGYHHLDAGGNQILLNYRATDKIAQSVTLSDVLDGRVPESLIRDRVILIGVTAPSVQDDHVTPLGRMRGLEVHAHYVSQLLSTILDDRPLIHWLSIPSEIIWILSWSLIGSISIIAIKFYVTSKRMLFISIPAVGCITVVLYLGCLLSLERGLWLPLVPSVIACVSAASIASLIVDITPDRARVKNS